MFLGTLAGTWLALQTSPTQMTDSHALLHSCAVSLIATAVELSTQPSTFLENIENFLVPISAILAHWYLNRAHHRSASKRSAMQAARLQSRAVS
jgi:purine-cytosine permease-like protein